MYKEILKYLKDNDNGKFIELNVNDLSIPFDVLFDKLKELETAGRLIIEPSKPRVVDGDIILTHDKSSKLKAKILLPGCEYLESLNVTQKTLKKIPKDKKLKHVSDLISEIRNWTIFERSKVENFIERAKDIVSYIDGSSSPFIAQIDVFSTKNLINKIIVEDWNDKMLTVLNKLKNKIDFEEQDIDNLNQDLIVYVSQTRIEELKSIESNKFHLIKLIQLCKELNDAYRLRNYYTVGMLVRTLINHVPPIFSQTNFDSVVNQYKSNGNTKSFKESMEHLEKSSRKIADSYVHSIVRNQEILPTETQIDFRQGLDVLLGEIVRVLK